MKMIIAVPIRDNILCQHFGHCDKFAIFEAENKEITEGIFLIPPPHEPGVLPVWLASKGVTHIIAGGMGQRAKDLFNHRNIQVITGAEEISARSLVENFLSDSLVTRANTCDH